MFIELWILRTALVLVGLATAYVVLLRIEMRAWSPACRCTACRNAAVVQGPSAPRQPGRSARSVAG